MKPWFESKTLWLNGLTIVALAVTQLSSNAVIMQHHPRVCIALGSLLAVLNIVLRLITTKPIAGATK